MALFYLIKKVFEAYSNLGSILIELGLIQEVEFFLRKAIELNPNLYEAHSNLANLLSELGKLDESIICRINALKLRPDDEKLILPLAHHLCNDKKYNLTVSFFSLCLFCLIWDLGTSR